MKCPIKGLTVRAIVIVIVIGNKMVKSSFVRNQSRVFNSRPESEWALSEPILATSLLVCFC